MEAIATKAVGVGLEIVVFGRWFDGGRLGGATAAAIAVATRMGFAASGCQGLPGVDVDM